MSTEKTQVMKKRSRLYLFCEGTSIRGMHKVLRARTRFLKMLWMTFVLVMTTILIIASTFLVLDYLQYKTAWKVSTMLDEDTVFPSITLCSHNPFSVSANSMWSEKKIYSPTQLRHSLVNLMKRAYFRNTSKYRSYISLPLYDKIDVYYAQITSEEASKLSHNDHMIRFCMNVYDGQSFISSNCSDTIFYLVRLSNADYFNCWSIESKQLPDSYTAQSHQIILSITPSSDIHEMKNSFLMDMLSRGEGIRMTVHEPGTFPDITRNGINLQPGKMNDISFKTIRWRRRSTPKNPCKLWQPSIVDLDKTFNYTFSQCLNTEVQRHSIEKCKCMSTLWPRPELPSQTLPYCMKFFGTTEADLTDFVTRTQCLNDLTLKMKEYKAKAEGTKCFKRCVFYTYDLTTSVTKWSPSNRKLSRLRSIYTMLETTNATVDWLRDYENLILNRNNNSEKSSNDSNLHITFSDNSRFIYVSLTRKSFDIKQMTEDLVLDINILISRIGGLCSLCIGLTCAFFMELIEFVYLYFCADDNNNSNNNNYANNGQLDDPANNSNRGSAEAPAWYNQPRQETSYQFPIDAPSHHVMLETDSSAHWNSPWHKMNSNHELSSRRMDPSISCV